MKNEKTYKIEYFWKHKVLVPAYVTLTIISILTLVFVNTSIEFNENTQKDLVGKVFISSIVSSLEIGDLVNVREMLFNFNKGQNYKASIVMGSEVIITSSNTSNKSVYVFDTYDIISSSNKKIGYLSLGHKKNFLQRLIISSALLISPLILIFIIFFVIKRLRVFLHDLRNGLRNLDYQSKFEEIDKIQELVKKQSSDIVSYENKILKQKVYKQVAHDIRSPLSALDMSVSLLDNIDSDHKKLITLAINRIHDIANNLMNKTSKDELPINTIESTSLSSVIFEIISEKRAEYRDRDSIEIGFNLSSEVYGLFSKVNSSEFKRIISNIINNSVEAIEKMSGHINIEILDNNENNFIVITDNGKGIKKENLISIFEEGKSFEKTKGTGLGLFHARCTLEEWGGKIACESEINIGTSFKIELPKSEKPDYHVDRILIPRNYEIVILDDDKAIHDAWKYRLKALNISRENIFYYSSPETFLSGFKGFDRKKVIYFFDYDLSNSSINGLEVFEKIDSSNKYLVTSKYYEKHVKSECIEKEIFLIDKSMLNYISIEADLI